MLNIDDITDELYGLPPEEFTAARARFEKEAKAAGDRDIGARIHALAKPTVTAWLANQLAREHRDELKPLLELGAELRDATRNLAGDQLRALSRQRNELIYALVQHARKLAHAAGRSVSDDVARALTDTVHAALADEDAARLLLAGHLTDGLHSSEFGTGFGDSAHITNVIPISRKQSTAQRDADERERRIAEQELINAQRALADATAELTEARAALQRAEDAVRDAERTHHDAERKNQDAERKNRDAQARRGL